jgi:hypothetical protein
LYLLAQTRYGTNAHNNVLAPALNQLQAFTWQFTRAYTAEASLHQLIAVYESGDSSTPDLRPQPQIHDDPLAMLNMAEPVVERPLHTSTTLSDLSTATPPIFTQLAIEQALPDNLTPIQPQFAFMPYDLPDIDPLAWLASQGTEQPVLDVLPQVVTQLDHAVRGLASVVP